MSTLAAKFEPNKKWFEEASKIKVDVPVNVSAKQKAEAVAKELKRRGLIK